MALSLLWIREMLRPDPDDATSRAVLIVDDQVEALSSTREVLEEAGCAVHVAETGEAALELVRTEGTPVVVISDDLPGVNTAQLVEQVRALDPFAQIIVQTNGRVATAPARMLAGLGVQGHHDKADDPERLLLWVQVALQTSRVIEQLRQRERIQQELVAHCSHEFRTPLNVISGYADLLGAGLASQLDPSLQRAVSSILEATRGLTDLVTDFLAFSKVQARVESVQTEVVEIDELLAELRRQAGMLVEAKGLVFEVVRGDVPSTVRSDPVKVRTILRNLIGNALKFTRHGGITLRLDCEGDGIVFSVTDTGPGIAPEDLQYVFEPYRQLETPSTKGAGGFGLGLAICSKMARLLGGELGVSSEVGRGSTFTLALPRSPTVDEAAASERSA